MNGAYRRLIIRALFGLGGLYLNGVGLGSRWEGTFPGYTGPAPGNCSEWTEWQSYSNETRQSIYEFAQASMDSFPVRLVDLLSAFAC
jgi:hypothetical protein